jgi:DNA-3-methyladenine glycosylase I
MSPETGIAIGLDGRPRCWWCLGTEDFEKVAAYGAKDIERLLSDPGVVRNRKKIEAAITNARPVPKTMTDLEATTAESKALAKELKHRGFVFVGPTTAYATMEAIGVVNDHLSGCAFRRET